MPPFARPIPSVCPSVCDYYVEALQKRWVTGLRLLWGVYRKLPLYDPSSTPIRTPFPQTGLSQPPVKTCNNASAML